MKVLQVNTVYHNGSTGKIVHDIHTELLKHGFESIVCYGNGPVEQEPNVHRISDPIYEKWQALISRITGIMYGWCFFSTNRLFRIIKREKPDIVHLHCLNGHFVNIYRLITWLKKNNIKTMLTLHAEFMYTGGCGHSLSCEKWMSRSGCGSCPRWRKETKSWFFDRTHTIWRRMKDAFEGFEKNLTVVSVSPWLCERAKQSPILADKNHRIILNGIDTEVFHFNLNEDLRRKYAAPDERIIFHATPDFNNHPDHIKGGYYVLKLAERMQDEKVKFLVAGKHDSSLTTPDNVVLLGRIDNQKTLAQLYSMAHITLLTSKKETFSLICAESMCCGTPVVGFSAGAPELI